LSDLAYCN
jgi:hypothetical protein